MKIFYITDTVIDRRLAPAIHVDEVCKNFSNLGHDVVLYAPGSDAHEVSGVYKIRAIPSPRFLASVFYQIGLTFRLLIDVVVRRPQVIYSRASQLLFVPALIAKIFRVPLIIEVNGVLLEETRQIDRNIIGRILLSVGMLAAIENFNLKNSSAIVAVTPGIKNHLLRTYGLSSDKITVVSNGVDTDMFRPLPAQHFPGRVGLTPEHIQIGYIGSPHSWQGVRYVVEAAKLVCEKKPRARFLIIGKGDEAERIAGQIRKNGLEEFVTLRGPVAHTDVPLYMNGLDICVSYPIKARGGTASPFKVYEYLSCAKPVIASDLEGMRTEFLDVVEYVEPENAQLLAQKMIALIDDEGRRTYLGKHGREFVEQGHTWKAVAQKLLTLCEENIRQTA